jgi:hypothetical protein
MNIREKFWWKIRDCWHYPQMFHQCVKPPTFWDETNYYYIFWLQGHYNSILRLILRHTRALIVRLYWAFWYKIGLSCQGGYGWQTRLCDWLEDMARKYDNRED